MGFVRATYSNTACQISASVQVGVSGSFLTICSTRGIADAMSNWFASTRLYNRPVTREGSQLFVKEGYELPVRCVELG
jgi:hypothetical protein